MELVVWYLPAHTSQRICQCVREFRKFTERPENIKWAAAGHLNKAALFLTVDDFVNFITIFDKRLGHFGLKVLHWPMSNVNRSVRPFELSFR